MKNSFLVTLLTLFFMYSFSGCKSCSDTDTATSAENGNKSNDQFEQLLYNGDNMDVAEYYEEEENEEEENEEEEIEEEENEVEEEDDIYSNFTGHRRKYFDGNWYEVKDSSIASYYRELYCVDGKICADSLTKDYYISGELQFEGHIKSENPDVLIGECVWYHKNGKIESTVTNDNNGLSQGEYLSYYEDGSPEYVKYYVDNKLDGRFIQYHPNGKIGYESFYKNGKQEGKTTIYFDDGSPNLSQTYANGILDGYDMSYYPNGKIEYIFHYKNGLKNGEYSYYYENGIKKATGTFVNGSLEGVAKRYNMKGGIKEIETFKNDRLDGECQMYYSNGQLKFKGNVKNSQKVGTWEYYYSDGRAIADSSDITGYRANNPRNIIFMLQDELIELMTALYTAGIEKNGSGCPMQYDNLKKLIAECMELIEKNNVIY